MSASLRTTSKETLLAASEVLHWCCSTAEPRLEEALRRNSSELGVVAASPGAQAAPGHRSDAPSENGNGMHTLST